MGVGMEPTRYWLLFAGIFLVFLSSRLGQIVCWRLFNILRSAYYLALAVLALCGALFFRGLGAFLCWLAIRIKKSNSENPDTAPSTCSKM